MGNDFRNVDDLREALREFVRERDWERFHTPKNLAIGVSIEAAELVENFHWMTSEESARPTVDERKRIDQEIGDVVIYLLLLCDKLDIDPLGAARRKLEANRVAYPVKKARGSRQKYDRL